MHNSISYHRWVLIPTPRGLWFPFCGHVRCTQHHDAGWNNTLWLCSRKVSWDHVEQIKKKCETTNYGWLLQTHRRLLKLRFVDYAWLSHLWPPVVLIVGCDGWRHCARNLHMNKYHVWNVFVWVCFDDLWTYPRMEDHSTSLVLGSCSCQCSFPFECYCSDIETIMLRPVPKFRVEIWVNELYHINSYNINKQH